MCAPTFKIKWGVAYHQMTLKCNGPITDEISSIKLDLPVTYAIMREDAKGPTCILAITVRTLTSGHTT
uniref:Uncharacterized protein n=1 Tax=Magallana gigas TaxID=29159 RepID=K1QPX2_MAGGI